MSRRPNILWILTDQHSPHVAGFAGNPIVQTQALDDLSGPHECVSQGSVQYRLSDGRIVEADAHLYRR